MGNFSRKVKRFDQILRKGRSKKNTRGERVGQARTPNINEMNSQTKWVHVPRSRVPKGVELGDPVATCRHCHGVGIAGWIVAGSKKREDDSNKEDLICSCVVGQIDFDALEKEEEKSLEDIKKEQEECEPDPWIDEPPSEAMIKAFKEAETEEGEPWE